MYWFTRYFIINLVHCLLAHTDESHFLLFYWFINSEKLLASLLLNLPQKVPNLMGDNLKQRNYFNDLSSYN